MKYFTLHFANCSIPLEFIKILMLIDFENVAARHFS